MEKQKIDYYNSFDDPIPYKKLLFYPIKVDKYMDFHMASNCIIINKNEIPDPKVISMPYLDFIFWFASQSEEHSIFLVFLSELLKMTLHIETEDIRYKTVKVNNVERINLMIKDETYDGYDFDEFRQIICAQNGIELDEDSDMHPDMKKALNEALAFKNKNKKKMCSFNEQIVCVMIEMHEVDKQKIRQLTIKTFSEILQRYDAKLHYEIYKKAEMSGQVTFKEEITHWMSDLSEDDRYKDIKVDFDEFKAKIEGNKE